MCTSTDIQTRRLLGLPPRQRPEYKPQVKNEEYSSTTVTSSVGKRGNFVQPKVKLEEPVLMEIAPPPDVIEADRRNSKRKQQPVNNREELLPFVQLKKLKIEKQEPVCTICKKDFSSEQDLYGHKYMTHVPNYSKYGCSSCGIALDQQQDWKQHMSWHTRHKELYFCPRCKDPYDKFVQYSK